MSSIYFHLKFQWKCFQLDASLYVNELNVSHWNDASCLVIINTTASINKFQFENFNLKT